MSSNTYGRTGEVSILRADDVTRLTELERAEESARKRLDECRNATKAAESKALTMDEADDAADALADAEGAWQAAKDAADAFAAEADERAASVVMHSLGRTEWRELMGKHQPRPEKEVDREVGVNMDTLPDELVPRSIDVEASRNIVGSLDKFLDSLSDYDYYDRLYTMAFSLNRGRVSADPKARLRSQLPPTTPATSN